MMTLSPLPLKPLAGLCAVVAVVLAGALLDMVNFDSNGAVGEPNGAEPQPSDVLQDDSYRLLEVDVADMLWRDLDSTKCLLMNLPNYD